MVFSSKVIYYRRGRPQRKQRAYITRGVPQQEEGEAAKQAVGVDDILNRNIATERSQKKKN